MENLGFKVGDVVTDGDTYEAKIIAIDPETFEATIDYDGFPSDVPPEVNPDVWPLDELVLADDAAEAARQAEVIERYES